MSKSIFILTPYTKQQGDIFWHILYKHIPTDNFVCWNTSECHTVSELWACTSVFMGYSTENTNLHLSSPIFQIFIAIDLVLTLLPHIERILYSTHSYDPELGLRQKRSLQNVVPWKLDKIHLVQSETTLHTQCTVFSFCFLWLYTLYFFSAMGSCLLVDHYSTWYEGTQS